MGWMRSARAAGESNGRGERSSSNSAIGRLSCERTNVVHNVTSVNNFHAAIGGRRSAGASPRRAAKSGRNGPAAGGAPQRRRRAADGDPRPQRTATSVQRTGTFVCGTGNFVAGTGKISRGNREAFAHVNAGGGEGGRRRGLPEILSWKSCLPGLSPPPPAGRRQTVFLAPMAGRETWRRELAHFPNPRVLVRFTGCEKGKR